MQIYNTLTRRKEDFVPLNEGEARIYACGPTVYNYFHIGNARPFTLFDTLRRYLAWRGYKVTYVQNFTDIDDKMINAAHKDGITIGELADRFIAEYKKDAKALNISPADIAPRATEHIGEIVALIQALADKGLAYESADGVYFDTQAYPGYGKLSGQSLQDREAGARIEVDENKKNPMDFALWKKKKPDEPHWPSPWGDGRPGWHIECSAMSMKYLGENFDIHTGGVDLIFPHHENEIAQSEGATGKPFVKYWMHNGHINVDNKKMSKSEGNFFTVRDIAEKFDLEAVRLFLLSSHYRSPINFSAELVEQAQNGLQRLYNARDTWKARLDCAVDRLPTPKEQKLIAQTLPALKEQFIVHMDDDLNTAGAVGVLYDLVREGNTALVNEPALVAARAANDLLAELCGVLGLLYREGEAVDPQIEALAAQRQQARAEKNWAEADRLRAEIGDRGYIVEDSPKGYILKKK